MGRAERRLAAKMSKQFINEDKSLERDIIRARANMKRLASNEVDRIQQELTDMNLNCVFTAFSTLLYQKGWTQQEIADILTETDNMVGSIGTEKYPTVKEFCISCAKIHGINIGLTDEESEEVEAYLESQAESNNKEEK